MRDPEEKARFRGDDKAYSEGWERIFGKKESIKTEKEDEENNTNASTDNYAGNIVRYID